MRAHQKALSNLLALRSESQESPKNNWGNSAPGILISSFSGLWEVLPDHIRACNSNTWKGKTSDLQNYSTISPDTSTVEQHIKDYQGFTGQRTKTASHHKPCFWWSCQIIFFFYKAIGWLDKPALLRKHTWISPRRSVQHHVMALWKI